MGILIQNLAFDVPGDSGAIPDVLTVTFTPGATYYLQLAVLGKVSGASDGTAWDWGFFDAFGVRSIFHQGYGTPIALGWGDSPGPLGPVTTVFTAPLVGTPVGLHHIALSEALGPHAPTTYRWAYTLSGPGGGGGGGGAGTIPGGYGDGTIWTP